MALVWFSATLALALELNTGAMLLRIFSTLICCERSIIANKLRFIIAAALKGVSSNTKFVAFSSSSNGSLIDSLA